MKGLMRIRDVAVPVHFKSEELCEEFRKVDPRIQAITLMLAFHSYYNWKHTITVTCIYRSQGDQNYYYKKGLTKARHSPHTSWRAIDIRLKDIPKRADEMVTLLNKGFPRSDQYKTALAHGKGSNFHCHIQVPSKGG